MLIILCIILFRISWKKLALCHRYTDKYPGLESPHVSPLTSIQMRSLDHCYPLRKRRDSEIRHLQYVSVKCQYVRVFI